MHGKLNKLDRIRASHGQGTILNIPRQVDHQNSFKFAMTQRCLHLKPFAPFLSSHLLAAGSKPLQDTHGILREQNQQKN